MATSRLTPPFAWYFRVVLGGPFIAMPLRLHLRNEDSATDELSFFFLSSDEFFNMSVISLEK